MLKDSEYSKLAKCLATMDIIKILTEDTLES